MKRVKMFETHSTCIRLMERQAKELEEARDTIKMINAEWESTWDIIRSSYKTREKYDADLIKSLKAKIIDLEVRLKANEKDERRTLFSDYRKQETTVEANNEKKIEVVWALVLCLSAFGLLSSVRLFDINQFAFYSLGLIFLLAAVLLF